MGNATSSGAELSARLSKLVQHDVSGDNILWKEVLFSSTSEQTVFAAASPKLIRELIKKQPENYKRLVTKSIEHLEKTLAEQGGHAACESLLTCVRVLTRAIPFSFEVTSTETESAEVERVFWSEANPLNEENLPLCDASLGKRLVHAIMKLLFLPGFTVAEQREPTNGGSKDALVWAAGLGQSKALNASANARHDQNRTEVLKLLLGCLSKVLYTCPEKLGSMPDPWLRVATDPACPNSDLLFASLINVAIGYDPVGMGLPYVGAIMEDPREELAVTSLHVILALLDFAAPPPPLETADGTANHPSIEPTVRPSHETHSGDLLPKVQVTNAYREAVRLLSNENHFRFLFGGFMRLLNNYHESVNTYMPNSMKQVEFHQELLLLFWKLIDGNPQFLSFCVGHVDIYEIVFPCLYFMWTGRGKPSMVGLVHLCTFVLLLLSGDRSVGVAMNTPYNGNMPLADLPTFTGTCGDLLIIVFHKLIVSSQRQLSSLFNCFLTIISNVSPYLQNICLPSSLKLLNLFELFSSHRYLMSQRDNHQYVFFLLDIFNNVIQYQFAGNCQLVYALIRRKKMFDRLKLMSIPVDGNAEDVANNVTTEVSSPDGSKPSAHQNGDENVISESFVPSIDWLNNWKRRLPIGTVMRLLDHLVPLVEQLCRKCEGQVDEGLVLDYIKNTTLVGILPIPHPIVVRRYQPNKFTNIWFTTYLWGVLFLRNQKVPLFDGTKIKLFRVHVS